MNPKVDFYFNKGKWQKELEQLRKIVLDWVRHRRDEGPRGNKHIVYIPEEKVQHCEESSKHPEFCIDERVNNHS